MKIFIGTEEIASILYQLGEGFKANGHEVTTYIRRKNKYYNSLQYNIVRDTLFDEILKYSTWRFISNRFKNYFKKIDNEISKPWLWFKNKKLVQDHDIFIFIWEPWFSEEKLFPYLKKKGKKIICLHVGSDVRHFSAFEQEYKTETLNWESTFHDEDVNTTIQKIRVHELYADLIYSVPDQAGLMIRPYNHLFLPFTYTNKIVFKLPDRDIPLILHAPSRSGIKGTNAIKSVIAQLKKDGYKFNFKLIENLPNEELIPLLSEADILCDQLYINGPAVLSTEAMAAGCVVLTKHLNMKPFTPPVVSVTAENLYDELLIIIKDKKLRIDLAIKAKEYIVQNNDAQIIAQKMLEDLEGKNIVFDYYPDFFINEYKFQNICPITKKTKKMTSDVLKKLGLSSINYSLRKRNLI